MHAEYSSGFASCFENLKKKINTQNAKRYKTRKNKQITSVYKGLQDLLVFMLSKYLCTYLLLKQFFFISSRILMISAKPRMIAPLIRETDQYVKAMENEKYEPFITS